ncbi:MAG: ABC-2 family transporter protein [Bacillota bacterium]|nr:ABC-2 family transporter protein [Bacillota bacterium]
MDSLPKKKRLNLYLPFAKSEIQRAMSYRMNFFMFAIGGLIQVFVTYYLWIAIFKSSPTSTLNGFTLSNIIVYIFMSNITARAVNSSGDMIVGEEVLTGDIAMNLIRPISYHLRLLFQCLGTVAYQFVTLSVPMWIGLILVRYYTAHELPPSIGTILLYTCSCLLSFYILFLFNFCFGMLAFYVTYIWGLRVCKNSIFNFFSGQIIPLAFFPLWFQHAMNFVPFGSINYTPVMIYLQKLTGYEALKAILVQVVWIGVLFLISRLIWKKATKRLMILGG